jgi:hypothetical protein
LGGIVRRGGADAVALRKEKERRGRPAVGAARVELWRRMWRVGEERWLHRRDAAGMWKDWGRGEGE